MGGYSEGGGENQRVSITAGHSWGKLDFTGALQLEHSAPIWGYDRSYTDSSADNPTLNGGPVIPPRAVLILNGNTGKYVDPGAAACGNLSAGYGGTLRYVNRPGSGYYCGSDYSNGYQTFVNGSKAASVYLNAKYHATDNVTFYGDLLYNRNKIKLNSGSRFWFSSIDTGGYFVNANTGRFELWQRFFTPEEIGASTNNDNQTSDSYTVTAGAQGTFGKSNWDWNAYYFRSEQKVKDSMLWPLKSKVEQFFLGQQQGDYYGYPIYAPDANRMYTPITEADYRGFSAEDQATSKTYTQNVNLQLTNTSLFSLPAGDVGVAGLLQAGEQYWENPTDPRVIAGDFWGLTGTQGAGKRRNYAAALEFRVPIFSMLSANVSGRYDDFRYGGQTDSKATYKLGLEFRPFDSLLIRGNYATAFRSPDMGYLFAGPSGYFTQGTDYYYCRTQEPNVPISNCTQNAVNISGRQAGNIKLKSITAKSWGYGVVWSPSAAFTMKADYYHISIANEVNSLSIDRILQDEANCRIGSNTAGDPYDINSGLCQSELALVHRLPANNPQNPNGLSAVDTLPINISDEVVNGVIASANWRHDMGSWGTLGLGADYNVLLKHTYRQIAGDPVQDLLGLRSYYNGYRDVATGNIDWEIGDWSFSVLGTRRGKTFNYAGTGKVGAWTTYNASMSYKFSESIDLSLISNNVTNKRPPFDKTYAAYPYYNIFNYNPLGRAIWFQATIHFQ